MATKNLTLTSLVIDGVDEEEDIIYGSAEPGSCANRQGKRLGF